MNRGRNYVDRAVFEEMLRQVPTAAGENYQDVATIYGDMSRLAVALLANTPPDKLAETYNELGWGGNANVRAIHATAREWYKTYHPGRLRTER